MPSDFEQFVARLNRLEDQLAVHEVIASYGLAVDGCMPDACGQLWTEDCWYDSDAAGAPEGGFHTRQAIESMIRSGRNVTIGFAHITHPPVVVIEGDVATAYAASELPTAQDGRTCVIGRVSANKWDLRRVASRWQIQRRTSRALDGSPESKSIFAEAARAAESDRLALLRLVSEGAVSGGETSAEDASGIEERIAAIEQKLAVLQLIAAYGPATDSGAGRESGAGDEEIPPGGEELGPPRAESSIAHISHFPIIKVAGDQATAVNHSNTFIGEDGKFRLDRISASRWDFARADGSWEVTRRVDRPLSGSPEARAFLADGARQVLDETQTSEA
jgi:hypothetical protein